MKIRTGNYTVYHGYHCRIFEIRSETHVKDFDKEYDICYEMNAEFDLKGFEKHPHEKLVCTTVPFKKLTNAYSVKTFGKYKNEKVQVFEKELNDPKIVEIGLRDKRKALDMGLFELYENWYVTDINIDEISEIWEERFPVLGLPISKDVSGIHFINDSNKSL